MSEYTLQIIVIGTQQGVDQVASQIEGIGDAAKNASGPSDGFFSSLFKNATNIASSIGLIKGFASGIVGLASGMVAGNAEFERYQTQFGVLLGSADAAKQRLAELADFGAKTPFELPEVVKADKILQSFGLESADAAAKFGFNASQIRTIAGDVASGTGASFEEMSLLLGKFSTGATGEAIARMAELGIASKSDLAAMGLEFSKSGQLLSPLPESMSVVLQLMKQKFGGMMDAQSMTFEGMVSNLQDWVGQTKRVVMAPIFDVLKVQLAGLLVFLGSDTVKGAIQSFAELLAGGIGATLQFIIGSVIPAFVAGWGLLQQGLAAAQPYLDMIGGILTTVGQYLAEVVIGGDTFNDWLSQLPAFLQPVLVVLGNYINVWMDVVETMSSVIGALTNGDIQGAFFALSNGFAAVVSDYQIYAASLGQLLLDLGVQLISSLASWGQALIDWIAPYIGPALAALQAWAAQLWAWIVAQAPAWLAQLQAWGQALIAWIAPMIGPALAALGGLLGGLLGWVASAVTPLLAQLQTWANAFLEWIPGATVSFLAAWPGMLNSFLGWIASAVGPLLAQLGSWAIAFLSWIIPMIPGFLQALAGIALALAAFIVETAAVLVVNVAKWALAMLGWIGTEVLPKLPGLLGGILSTILGWISGIDRTLWGAASAIGKAILDGIIAGAKAGVGALVDAVKGAATSALNAAKSALGIHSPSAVMAAQVGAPIVDGIAMGIEKATPKLTEKMLDLAGKLVDLVARGVDAFGKLGQLGQIPHGAIQTFASTIQETLNTFSATVVQWDKAAMSAASQFTKKAGDVIEIMSKGVDFFTKLDALRSVPDAQIKNFVRMLGTAMTALIELSTRDMRIALMGAVEFAGGAGKMLEIIGKGAEALGKLGQLGPIPLSAFQAFRAALKSAIYTFVTAAAEWSSAPIAAATAFAESSGKMLDIIGKGAEALGKLADFDGVPLAAFQAFRAGLKSAIYTFVVAAAEWANAPITASVQFAEASTKILESVGKGADALGKLADFAPIPLAAFVAFRDALRQGVALMVAVSQLFDVQAIDAAAVFAQAVGKMLSIVGSAVDGFTKLADFKGVANTAYFEFATALYNVVELFTILADNWSAEAVAAAGVFATGAGKTTAIVGQAVDGFTKLADFKGVASSVYFEFATALYNVVELFTILADNWSAEAVAAAGVFATGAGKTTAIVGQAVDGFTKLADFKGVSDAAIAAFGVALAATVRAIAQVSTTFAADAVAAAAVFADGAGKTVAVIGHGIDGFIKLTDFKGVSDAAIAAFAVALQRTLQSITALAGLWSAEGLAAAIAFAEAANKVTAAISGALDTFKKLGDYETIGPAVVAAFSAGLADLLAQLQRLALPAANDIGQQIMTGLINGILSMRSLLLASMVNSVMAAVYAAKAALGIQSPSVVLEQQVGAQMSAGIARGISGAAYQVDAAMGGVASRAPGQLASAGAGLGGGGGSIAITFEAGAIVQQPGQDAEELANYVIAQIERRMGGRSI